jgi:hypothetical protein
MPSPHFLRARVDAVRRFEADPLEALLAVEAA